MATAASADQGNMLTDINTTPLIDVMLVLLIMFIITIPIQTHSVKLDLPAGPGDAIQQIKNDVVITRDGRMLWNGSAIDLIRLRQYLAITQRMRPVPELHLEPEALAPYAVVDQVLGITKRAQVEKMGFVGNEKYVAAF